MKNRIELAKFLAGSGRIKGAEIGVFAGYYSEKLCKFNPELELHCVDPWNKNYMRADKVFSIAKELLSPYRVHFWQKTSLEASKEIADGYLDFVYIDGEHSYESVKEDIEAWAPKVKKGGVVAGDDFYKTGAGNMGVIDAVCEYASNHRYNLKITDWDETNLNQDDRQPNWYFTKGEQ